MYYLGLITFGSDSYFIMAFDWWQFAVVTNRNVHRVKYHPSFQKGGSHEVHDIEDLVKVGQVVRGMLFMLFLAQAASICSTSYWRFFFFHCLGCSYYAARSMADDAQLILCPYNYVINPVIRGAMDVDIKEAIVIFDEAQYVSCFSSVLMFVISI